MNICKLEKLIETYKERRKEIEKELLPSGIIPRKLFIRDGAYKKIFKFNMQWISEIMTDSYCEEGIRISKDDNCLITTPEIKEYIFYLKYHLISMRWRVALFYVLPVGVGFSLYMSFLNNPHDWRNLFIALSIILTPLIVLKVKNKFDLHITIYEEIAHLLEYRLELGDNLITASTENDK